MTPHAQHARRPVLTLLPDYDDPDPTQAFDRLPSSSTRRVALPAPSPLPVRTARSTSEATVRAFVTALGDDQADLGSKLHALTSTIEGVSFDPAARPVVETLRRRAYDVAALREALDDVYLVAFDASLAPLYEKDAPLQPFLKGLYIWSDGVLDALEQLATDLVGLDPSWDSLRSRLAESSRFYFARLAGDVDAQVRRLRAAGHGSPRLDEMSARLDELFFAARWLSESLPQKFG
jgi:hypothetical protein